MTDPSVPPGIDVTRPSAARMYDYYLGGKDNFAVDREAAEEALATVPELREGVLAARAFLRRVVRYLAGEAGIRQFIDIGTGLPTQENTHQVAQAVCPGARVVYVDNDPVVLAHGRALLADNDATTVIHADMRQPEAILNHPETRELIDFDQPVAVLLLLMLHFITDEDDPAGIVARLRDGMAPGSYLVISHGVDEMREGVPDKLTEVYRRSSSPVTFRTREQVLRLFEGFDLVEPGLVPFAEWHADGAYTGTGGVGSWAYAGVGRKI